MASRLLGRLDSLERRVSIKNEGLLYTSDVVRRFGVSEDMARQDLRAVYGKLMRRPTAPRKPRQHKVTTGVNLMEQRKLERIQRQAFVKKENVKTSATIMQKFGVTRATALSDLRAVWGENHTGKLRRTSESSVHTNMWLSPQEHEAVATAAQALGCSISEAIRIAIQQQYLRNVDVLKRAANGEVR